jgi:hypothetical protein
LDKSLKVGAVIVLLSHCDAGKRFSVVERGTQPIDCWLCQEVDGANNMFRRVSEYTELFLKFPLPAVPKWALPLSVQDNHMICDVIMRLVTHTDGFGSENFDLQGLHRIIAFCWHHRIPIDATEMTGFLEAHGHPSVLREKTAEALEFGAKLLMFSSGKAPVKRRRMKPFEVFRYSENHRSPETRQLFLGLYGPPVKYNDLLSR